VSAANRDDILGNRLSLGTNSYGWDVLNRMTSYNGSSYQYRADGMRVAKTVGTTTTRFRYDGQMGMEDVDSTGKVTQYGLGARGIDFIGNPAAGVMFPVYDAHGNPGCASLHRGPGGMVATLARLGNNSYSLGSQRSFDACRSEAEVPSRRRMSAANREELVRLGAQNGDPSGRYCATLGHKQDDESGLIYMRARYYEPASGRFISEDGDRDGPNWYAYARGCPTDYVDQAGAAAILSWALLLAGIALVAVCIYGMQWGKGTYNIINKVQRMSNGWVTCIAAAALWCMTMSAWIEEGGGRDLRSLDGIGLALSGLVSLAACIMQAGQMGSRTAAGIAVFAAAAYGMRLLAELTLIGAQGDD
jgi:RHS repeat-associated protein